MKILRPLLVLLALGCSWLSAAPAPLKVHIVSASKEYQSEPSLKEFAAYLGRKGIECTASWAQDSGTTLPDLAPLSTADLMIVFARRLKLPEEQMKIVRAHWESGKPIIGIRTASHAWGGKESPDNATFDRQVLGNNYLGHYGDEKIAVTVAPGQSAHPVLAGVQPFTSRKLYKAGELSPTATPLQFGDNGKGRHPVTLVNEYKGGRIFYTSLGVPEDFKDENFRRMLLNAVYWTTRRTQPPQP
jgi:type 1 glutamine amidotransferase